MKKWIRGRCGNGAKGFSLFTLAGGLISSNPLVSTTKSDILVIGGGVVGLSIARELRRRGAGRVTVIDRGRCGEEASWAAAGMLAPNAETHEDGPFFQFCTASNALYPDFAAQLLEETDVDIELDRTGTLFLSFVEGDDRVISEKYEWQRDAGIVVERLTSDDVRRLEPEVSGSVRGGLLYHGDWQVENRKLVQALRRSCELRGVSIREGFEATEFLSEGHRIIGIRTLVGEISADTVVVANGSWACGLLGGSAIKPIRGQMISLGRGSGRVVEHVIYSSRGYVVPRADGRVLVGATVEDVGYRKEVMPEAIEELRDAALEIAPALGNFDIKEAWSGLRPFAADGLPVIGWVPGCEGLFMATGHFRNGILLAPITGAIAADAITVGVGSEYLEAFSPERFFSASEGAAVSNRV